jgi:protein phosphatase
MRFWKKLFGTHKKSDSETKPETVISAPPTGWANEITKPLDKITLPVEPETAGLGLEPPQLLASCAQSVGLQRDHNEDSLFSLTTILACNGSNIPFGLYIVADGMGGHQYGEIASELATRSMAEYVIRNLYTHLFSVEHQPPETPLREILHTGVMQAHNEIIQNVAGGGTTLTAVVILGDQMTIAHVGDSRIYSVSLSGRMKALTRDHSLVRRLEELGQLTPEEAAVHPQRNVLYRALGQGEPFEPEIITASIPQSEYLLVCSDGLWGVVPEEQLGKIIKDAPTLHQACQEMVAAANAAGGPDNITAILVRMP